MKANSILILNCFLDDSLAHSFDRALSRPIKQLNLTSRTIRIPDQHTLPEIDHHSHLVISGSEASALDEHSWYGVLAVIIMEFINHKKSVLGICFGHQFLARVLAGAQCLRRAENPEFGWVAIQHNENPLFKGISNLVSMVSHYDEVIDLPGDFKVFASSNTCQVQAMQHKTLPVYGIQFHPEYNLQESGEIFDAVDRYDKNFASYFLNDLQDYTLFKQNKNVMINFLGR